MNDDSQVSSAAIRTQMAARPIGFETASQALTLIAVPAIVVAGLEPSIGFFLAAFMFGWCELEGFCGTSHVLAITPLRRLDATNRLWLHSALAYTIGGTISAAVSGALAATVLGVLTTVESAYLYLTVLIIAFLGMRELGWITFALPQVPKQTDKMWG